MISPLDISIDLSVKGNTLLKYVICNSYSSLPHIFNKTVLMVIEAAARDVCQQGGRNGI